MRLKDLENKKILVLGFGAEGQDTYLALRSLFPNKVLGIADKKELKYFDNKTQEILRKDKHLNIYCGSSYLSKIGEYEVIIRSPGIADKVFKHLIKNSVQITSQTALFFDNFEGLVVGVTGTKGKGTTASLIWSILKKAGRKAYLAGNIGSPVLQDLLKASKDDIFVYEMSSHQLQDLKRSPCIAVFLNLYSDHLDYYRDLEEYQKAKENIAVHQKKEDYFIYNQDDKIVKKIAGKTLAQKIPFSIKQKKDLAKIVRLAKIPLRGDFNFLNVIAAVQVAEILEISKEKIKQGIIDFKPLEHRLEFIGKYKGIEFYDDSMSTIPAATIAAIRAMAGEKIILIAGGSEKGSSYSEMAKVISESKVKTLILLGKGTSEKIYFDLNEVMKKMKKNPLGIFFVSSMQEAVKITFDKAKAGDRCLMSPGSASFNLFRDYKDRGNQFKKFVRYYGGKKEN